jgi:hypothetical protein
MSRLQFLDITFSSRISVAAAILIFVSMFQPGPAQSDWLGGSLVGGTSGAIIGGLIGGGDGLVAGALIGGTIGAFEGDRRARNKRYYHRSYRAPRYYAPRPVHRVAPTRYARQSFLVLEVQQSLQRLGINPGAADGLMGAGTASAVRSYQKSNNLLVDGKVSAQLLEHMKERGG